MELFRHYYCLGGGKGWSGFSLLLFVFGAEEGGGRGERRRYEANWRVDCLPSRCVSG